MKYLKGCDCMKFENITKNTARKSEIKGLENATIIAERQVLPINDITAFTDADGNPQPFKVEQADVDVLAESIKKYGQLTPVTVRKLNGKKKYQLLSGHKRYFALLQNGEKTIDAKIIDCSDEKAVEIVTNANIQRDKPKPSELNALYHYYKNSIGEDQSVTDLSAMFGVSAKTLYRCIHLDNLINELVELVDNEMVSTMAIEIIDELDGTQQKVLADFVTIEEKLLTPSTAKKIIKMADEDIEFTVENIKEYLSPKKSKKEKKKYSYDFFNSLASENPDRYESLNEQELNDLVKTLLDNYFASTF